jgi:hypothetical protein
LKQAHFHRDWLLFEWKRGGPASAPGVTHPLGLEGASRCKPRAGNTVRIDCSNGSGPWFPQLTALGVSRLSHHDRQASQEALWEIGPRRPFPNGRAMCCLFVQSLLILDHGSCSRTGAVLVRLRVSSPFKSSSCSSHHPSDLSVSAGRDNNYAVMPHLSRFSVPPFSSLYLFVTLYSCACFCRCWILIPGLLDNHCCCTGTTAHQLHSTAQHTLLCPFFYLFILVLFPFHIQ